MAEYESEMLTSFMYLEMSIVENVCSKYMAVMAQLGMMLIPQRHKLVQRASSIRPLSTFR